LGSIRKEERKGEKKKGGVDGKGGMGEGKAILYITAPVNRIEKIEAGLKLLHYGGGGEKKD